MGDQTDKRNKRQKTSSYSGYRVGESDEVEEVNSSIKSKKFFESFVLRRKPVKIKPDGSGFIDLKNLSIDNIEKYLDYQYYLQVEKKFEHGFGSGLSREKMTLKNLMERLRQGDDSFYLTTQYNENENEEISDDENDNENGAYGDKAVEGVNKNNFENFSDTSSMGSIDFDDLRDDYEDEEEDGNEDIVDPILSKECDLTEFEAKNRIRELLQPPLTNAFNKVTVKPPLLKNLVPQQINLWMGYSKKGSTPQLNSSDIDLCRMVPGDGTSSGLHHDHADNLYILVSGVKRFTLYSPSDAEKLFTVGNISKVFSNGTIDYEDDNLSGWRHIREDGAILSEVAKWKLKNDNLLSNDTRKALQEVISDEEDLKHGDNREPPSFSKIPPALLHIEDFEDAALRDKLTKFSMKNFPGLLELNKLTVWLHPGDMLYLPAGWFHEVSSYGSHIDDLSIHVALNYWFSPPDSDSYEAPYRDSYWNEDWKKTEESVRLAREGIIDAD
ncbi:uncharacterized protein PRCAT00006035001 [Priceomyces carsonii]|uniref:uncharacterized protein n=1 Tax=Priceomyces carsonii TaxID=28549 RepID=UPI002EDA8661|nr:unnamed protein product [Priceomyces carsonii]